MVKRTINVMVGLPIATLMGDESAPFVVPSVANDIPLDQAVAEMHHISAELARSLCECAEQGALPCGACDTAPRRRV